MGSGLVKLRRIVLLMPQAVKTSALTTSGATATANATGGPSVMDIVTTTPHLTMTNTENQNSVERPRTGDEATGKSRVWQKSQNRQIAVVLRLPDNTSSAMRATASVAPQLWQPTSGIVMTNAISDTNTEDSIACFALSKNDSYVASASGGKISLFNMMTFKTMTTFMPLPPAATFLLFHPRDNNIIAVGMDDSSIHIYNVRVDEVKTKLKGHHKRVTGLAFSTVLNVLVSSGADSQLCVWNTDGWEKQTSRQLQIPGGRVAAPFADTHVQFHHDQKHLLVVHGTQIAIFEAPKLECLKQWGPREASGAITHAAYSCDSQTIYVTFEDGSIDILTASTLRLRCRVSPTSYLPANPKPRVYPLVVAAHPSEPNQFALGLTDGGVCVFEPLESEGKWGSAPGVEGGAGPSTSAVAAAANSTDQA